MDIGDLKALPEMNEPPCAHSGRNTSRNLHPMEFVKSCWCACWRIESCKDVAFQTHGRTARVLTRCDRANRCAQNGLQMTVVQTALRVALLGEQPTRSCKSMQDVFTITIAAQIKRCGWKCG